MDKRINEIVQKYAKEVQKIIPVKMMILYGSYAIGDFNEFSDIDIVVIVDEINKNYLEMSSELFNIVRKVDIRIEPVLICSKNDNSGFLENILKNGIIFFENGHIKKDQKAAWYSSILNNILVLVLFFYNETGMNNYDYKYLKLFL